MYVIYTVRVEFDQPNHAANWAAWLRSGHIDEVLRAGAEHAELSRIDHETLTVYEVRYRFRDRTAFQKYETEHAPRLRAEGLEKFPVSRGIRYIRSLGEVIHVKSTPQKPIR